MLAGHNRQNVARIIHLPVIACIVKENLSDEEAWIYVIEANVLQRSFKDLLPSEKAMVESVLAENEYPINPEKAVPLRNYGGKLTPALVEEIISGAKNRKPKSATPPRKVKNAIFSKYFAPDVKQREFDRIVDEALELYFSKKQQDDGMAS